MERRYHLAANLATQFIEQGVQAIIAAGWAVDDEAALTFAQRFYEIFLNGTCFGDAVKEARATTQNIHPTVNTWGAYQCYGDPGYKITHRTDMRERDDTVSFVSFAEYLMAVKNIAKDAKPPPMQILKSCVNGLRGLSRDCTKNMPTMPDFLRLLGRRGENWLILKRP